MRSNYDYLAENGLLGRELTQQEIEDEILERQLEEQGWFDSPAYTVGQLEAEVAAA